MKDENYVILTIPLVNLDSVKETIRLSDSFSIRMISEDELEGLSKVVKTLLLQRPERNPWQQNQIHNRKKISRISRLLD